ncbi:hypothetical protein [Nocardia farcinica]|uniref:hypothetical protein n=1 Tax=Nocardia farcinica TaxID=37329 RepID=UPI00189594E4|nr:hypothetical protein [Nocardia farcinica]MBF6270735.1 hypothetical protein [Nocardia farcinica]
MHAYLFGEHAVHPRSAEPTAPLWPSRVKGGGHRVARQRYAVPFDWSQPMAMGTFYDTIFEPALLAVGLPATRPRSLSTASTRQPSPRSAAYACTTCGTPSR